MDKKWGYNGTEHELFMDFKRAYSSGTDKLLYNILIWYIHETSQTNKNMFK